jgi:hypothetical protein
MPPNIISNNKLAAMQQAVIQHTLQQQSIQPNTTPITLNPPYSPVNPIFDNEDDFDTYFGLAKELGVDNKEMIRERVRQIFKERDYKTYNTDNVVNYLNYKLGIEWKLYGVRKIDCADMKGKILSPKYHDIVISDEVYNRCIPLNILEMVQIISDAVPSAKFAISDNVNLKSVNDIFMFMFPSPTQKLPTYISAYWNESTFKDVS